MPDGPGLSQVDQARVWKADPELVVGRAHLGPGAGFEAEHYEVTRNGKTIEDDLSSTRLVDGDVVPETPYEYEVTAVDAAGRHGELVGEGRHARAARRSTRGSRAGSR